VSNCVRHDNLSAGYGDFTGELRIYIQVQALRRVRNILGMVSRVFVKGGEW
jgi:hypothetical protein